MYMGMDTFHDTLRVIRLSTRLFSVLIRLVNIVGVFKAYSAYLIDVSLTASVRRF